MKIEWISNEVRDIPCFGLGYKGRVFDVPEETGKSLVKQKLAKVRGTSCTAKKQT